MVNADKSALALAALITVIVYVLTVVPSCAVTLTSIVFEPTFKDNAADAEPLVTVE